MLTRKLFTALVCALLYNPVWVWAQITPADNNLPLPAELIVIGKNAGDNAKDFRFKMGESLTIKATGTYAKNIRDEITKTSVSKAVVLYFDDVPMSNLIVSPSEVDAGKNLQLSINLSRNSYDDENRKAWDMLLKKQHGYLMTLPVALSIGSSLPERVQSKFPMQFFVASKESVAWVLVVGAIIFIVGYWRLAKSSSALRDFKNGTYSLGKCQMAFWGLLVVLTFAGVWVLTGTMERIPQQVLILIGISGTTGLSAIVIGKSKEESKKNDNAKTLSKLQNEKHQLEKEKILTPGTVPATTDERLKEVSSEIEALKNPPTNEILANIALDILDDGNGVSFHRLQVVIWTVLLGAVFVVSVAQVLSMPEFPETLLILMGISNGTYLGFKFPEQT